MIPIEAGQPEAQWGNQRNRENSARATGIPSAQGKCVYLQGCIHCRGNRLYQTGLTNGIFYRDRVNNSKMHMEPQKNPEQPN